ALAEARTHLGASGDPSAKWLDRSLAAFDQRLAGKTADAGPALAALEWEQATVWARDFREHPFTLSVDRIAAAQWLADNEDFDQAARLLAIGDGAYLIHAGADYVTMLSGLIARERARIEEERGQPGAAREYYEEFLRRYDRPVPGHQSMVMQAKARVAALGE
ncbi:MAG TPA: hypothetical protein VLB12_18105, partial [Gemmatimonadales bacterium]|nr:hypothetical protein [Gemmatimonadales bacterium]